MSGRFIYKLGGNNFQKRQINKNSSRHKRTKQSDPQKHIPNAKHRPSH